MADGRETSRRILPGAATNVPRWPATVPTLDPPGRCLVLIAVGDDGAAVTARWQRAARRSAISALERTVSPWRDDDDDERYDEHVREVVDFCRVGDRVALAGPECDVMQLRAGLIDAGFLNEEVVVHATSTALIRVHCAHCRVVHRAAARPGELSHCQTCTYELTIHHHFSPRLAAYLGFRADAEQPT